MWRRERHRSRLRVCALLAVPAAALYWAYLHFLGLPLETRHLLSLLDTRELPPFRSAAADARRAEGAVLAQLDRYLGEYPQPTHLLPTAARAAAHAGSAARAAGAEAEDRYLQLDYPLGLGLNNVRWTLEWALYLAQVAGWPPGIDPHTLYIRAALVGALVIVSTPAGAVLFQGMVPGKVHATPATLVSGWNRLYCKKPAEVAPSI